MSAIRELIEAVEAGVLQGFAVEFADVLGAHAQHAAQAYHRDMNAALALMAAVLPEGWDWVTRSDKERGAFANVLTDNFLAEAEIVEVDDRGSVKRVVSPGCVLDGASFPSHADTPARALLLAILKAMEARG